MSLGEQLVQELMQMGSAELPLTTSASGEGISAAATISQWSPLAVGVDAIEVIRGKSGSSSKESLNDLAGRLAQKLTYLNEPIRVFEVDSEAGEARLRSNPPKTLPECVEYFELRLTSGGCAALRRIRSIPDRPSVGTPFTLTLEMLSRVIDDLSAAL